MRRSIAQKLPSHLKKYLSRLLGAQVKKYGGERALFITVFFDLCSRGLGRRSSFSKISVRRATGDAFSKGALIEAMGLGL